VEATKREEENPTSEEINIVFDLLCTKMSFLWYHPTASFPPKETFLIAMQKGNYSSLTTPLILKYCLNSDKMIQGHMKGQWQGIMSTKTSTLDTIREDKEEAHIKI
jgi:hypothetical protein